MPLLAVCAARVTNTTFSGYGNSTLRAINDFGCRRGYYEPVTRVGQDLNVDEQAKVALAYAALVGTCRRAPPGTVSALAWEWGLYCKDTVRMAFYRFKYGETIFSQRGRSVPEQIMDLLTNQEAVIKIIVDKKGRISGRRLQAAFRNATGIAVSRQTLVRHLKKPNLKITRRRYAPVLTENHKMTRSRFGTKYRANDFDRWIDLDEKWFVNRCQNYRSHFSQFMHAPGFILSVSKGMFGFCRTT